MRTFDLTPLFRSTVGFDRFADMLDSLSQLDNGVTYPPYNIERTRENHYRISLAVAGFAEKDLVVEVKEGVLSVSGKREGRRKAPSRVISTRGSPAARSSAASSSPRTSRSRAPNSRTGSCTSTSSVSCPKRRSPAASRSAPSPKAG